MSISITLAPKDIEFREHKMHTHVHAVYIDVLPKSNRKTIASNKYPKTIKS